MLFLILAAAAAPNAESAVSPAPAVQAPKPDPAVVAEALRLLDAEDFDANAIRASQLSVEAMTAAIISGLRKSAGEELPQDFLDQLKKTMLDHAMETVRANLASMKRQAAEVYAQEFTQAELIHLREIDADPVVSKARERSKVMQPKLMMIGIRTMQATQPELEAKLKRMVSDYLTAHGKAAVPSS